VVSTPTVAKLREVDGVRHRVEARVVAMEVIAEVEARLDAARVGGIPDSCLEVDDPVDRGVLPDPRIDGDTFALRFLGVERRAEERRVLPGQQRPEKDFDVPLFGLRDEIGQGSGDVVH